jgi:ribonuclease HI
MIDLQMQKMMKEVKIYTDGACKGNPGPGGWGAILFYGDHEKEMYGGESQTTNNIMELTAVIKALAALKTSCHVTLVTDSSYVKNGITKWIHSWKMNGWKTSNKKQVKNQQLWMQLEKETLRHQMSWKWVKGHAGDPGNERADDLANLGVEQEL